MKYEHGERITVIDKVTGHTSPQCNADHEPRASAAAAPPLCASSVPAGFPSPADDYYEGGLDLNECLIEHPAATFFVRARGDSMIDAGIHSGDLLIVDRALEPSDNRIVIAALNGELTVKRICVRGRKTFLVPENDLYEPIEITEDIDFQIWGVVTYVVHGL